MEKLKVLEEVSEPQDGEWDEDEAMRWCKYMKLWCGYYNENREVCLEWCVYKHGV